MKLTPRQRETLEAVHRYREKHDVTIQDACYATGCNSATYGNALRVLRFGPRAKWSGKANRIIEVGGVATDREAFSCEDETW